MSDNKKTAFKRLFLPYREENSWLSARGFSMRIPRRLSSDRIYNILWQGNIVQHIKGESSRKLQMEFPRLGKAFWGQHMWQIGYFCVTTGTVTEQTIKNYIAEQGKKEEEEDKTFQILS